MLESLGRHLQPAALVYGSYWGQNLKCNLRITLCGACFPITWKEFLSLALPNWNMELRKSRHQTGSAVSLWTFGCTLSSCILPRDGLEAPFGRTPGPWPCLDWSKTISSAAAVTRLRKTILESLVRQVRVQREWFYPWIKSISYSHSLITRILKHERKYAKLFWAVRLEYGADFPLLLNTQKDTSAKGFLMSFFVHWYGSFL